MYVNIKLVSKKMFFIKVFLEELIFFYTKNVSRKTHNSTLKVTVIIGSVSDI